MQHLDEGTIHSWLDGALSADEAARVHAHVAECPQCAAAVAEARGFIAASSRILTALDNAPRGVIPVAAPVKRVNPLVWRIAATVLVVAAGSLVVVQNRGSNEPLKADSAKQALTSSPPSSAAEHGAAGQTTVAGAADGAPPNAAVNHVPAVASAQKAATGNSRGGVTTSATKAAAERTSMRDEQTAAAFDLARVPAPAAPVELSGAAGGASRDAAIQPEVLKVVSTPRQIGAKVTVYEVAAGDTVTLTESMPTFLNSAVVTGAITRTQQMAPQATGKTAAAPSRELAGAASTSVAETRRTGEAAAVVPAVSPPPPTTQTGTAITLRTIRWTDPATGSTLTLTGRMPESRLQEIRIRIERERAAAAEAAKKNP